MKNAKRALALLLCLVMCIGFFPSTAAFADEDVCLVGEDTPPVDVETPPVDVETPVEEEFVVDVEKEEQPVRVSFVCTPEDLLLSVFSAEELAPGEEPVEIEPEENGDYLLFPGKYYYTASHDGFLTAEKVEFEVAAQEETSGTLDVEEHIDTAIIEIQLEEMFEQEGDAVCASVTSRNDGVWLFPLPSKFYNSFTDWCGCPGFDPVCSICGGDCGSKWGDSAHTNQGGHNGIDVGVGEGTDVYAASTGTIVAAEYNSARGNTIVIEHKISGTSYSYYSYYQHLSRFVKTSGDVSAGDLIAYSGSTGEGSGSHLHFGIVRGSSGRTGLSSCLNNLEGSGWVLSTGKDSGRILNNPALDSPCGFPTGSTNVVAPLKAHPGSVKYTFDKNQATNHNSIYPSSPEADYLSKCTYYPSYVTIKMTTAEKAWSMPCSSETNSKSKVVADLSKGTTYTATALYKNTVTSSDHYWYQIKVNGKTGYVYAPYVDVTSFKTGLSRSGKDPLTTHTKGENYPVDWTINSEQLDIITVDGYIYSGSNFGTVNYEGHEKNVNAKSINLNYKELDNALAFNRLDIGRYKLVISATAKNYYTADKSNTLKSRTMTAKLIDQEFSVVEGGHKHSYSSQVVSPTCTEKGYTLHTCSCGDSYKDSWVEARGHSWGNPTVAKEATCTEKGSRTYVCTVCGTKKTEEIPALGHDLHYKNVNGDCTHRPYVYYYCVRDKCEYDYTEYADGNWSEWSTEKPSGVEEKYIQSKQQYRTRSKDTTTGTSNSMPGWTLYDTKQVWGDYGSWSGWQKDYVASNDATQVETATVYGWYYFRCSNCGAHMHGYGTCWKWAGGCGAATDSSGWTSMYDPTPWSNASDWHGTGKYAAIINGERWFRWDDHGATTGYRYRTRTQSTIYYFYRWNDWSMWKDANGAIPAESDNIKVESRVLYRYDLYSTAQHTWNEGVVTTPAEPGKEGVKTYTCTICGSTKRETIPPLPIEYTVSYDANGGSGAPASQTKIQDKALTLSSTKPTRNGYSFVGWATSKSATSAQYQPGGSYTANAAVTLYAVWKANTYPVSYDANGGSGAPANQNKIHDKALTLSSAKPTRNGYSFVGWATSKSAASAQYQPGGTYTANAAVTLYAVWNVTVYTVSYDANGGSGAPASQNKIHDKALTLSSAKPTRSGYSFVGWATSKSATSAQYQPGGSYTANAAVTLYAVWKVNAPAYTAKMSITSGRASAGNTIKLNVNISNNPCIAAINFKIEYDKTRLKLTGWTDGEMKDWLIGVGEGESAVWVDEKGYSGNGTVLVLEFVVLDNAPVGSAYVKFTGMVAANPDEEAVGISVEDSFVEVLDRIPGDTNGDGVVNVFDLLRLKKHLAGSSVEINLLNADVTGDGKVDVFDLLRLKKYLAGMAVELK